LLGGSPCAAKAENKKKYLRGKHYQVFFLAHGKDAFEAARALKRLNTSVADPDDFFRFQIISPIKFVQTFSNKKYFWPPKIL
jgi:hypothetical protein